MHPVAEYADSSSQNGEDRGVERGAEKGLEGRAGPSDFIRVTYARTRRVQVRED